MECRAQNPSIAAIQTHTASGGFERSQKARAVKARSAAETPVDVPGKKSVDT